MNLLLSLRCFWFIILLGRHDNRGMTTPQSRDQRVETIRLQPVTSDLQLQVCVCVLGLTWTLRGLPGAAVRAAAASAAGKRAPGCGETQQNQQAAEPGDPAQRSHDGRTERSGGGGGEWRDAAE